MDFVYNKSQRFFILFVIVIAFAVLTFLDGFYTVGEQEQAVITMFGNIVRTDTAGLYFKIPYLQRVQIVDMTTHGTGIGYETDKSFRNVSKEDESVMITSDFNFVNIDFYLEYKVSDPVAYLYNSESPELILRNMLLSCIRGTVADYPVDEVITTGKNQIQVSVREKLTEMLRESNIGLQCVNLTVQDAEPPTEKIIQAFKEVETARQARETVINSAKKYRSEQIPKAEAEADKIIQEAEAIKSARIAEATGQTARFNNMYEEYKTYPLITKQRLFYETIEEILPNSKVIITDGNSEKLMPLDKF
ncbi:MAG: FtsH protease activity modulator HflK [Synergistaceae bacterium]|nr:FtsH protease activity modulator HflK [Synergistaceae bacterium]MBQ6435625.1 FtsH protease activity modulator HflK [Synergistaceae bacterium]MBQ6738170.1 FtsH protease activity modulator HflK [Synergistaceae bacterium]